MGNWDCLYSRGMGREFFALCVDLFSRCMTGRQRDIGVGDVDNKPKCLIETVLINLSLSSFFLISRL